GAHHQALHERVLGLRRTHRKRDDLAAVLCDQVYRLGHGAAVERVELVGHALADEAARLVVELEMFERRDLLDGDDDSHKRHSNKLTSSHKGPTHLGRCKAIAAGTGVSTSL